MTKKEFDRHRHLANTYNTIDSRVSLGSLSTEKYWRLYGGYPYANK